MDAEYEHGPEHNVDGVIDRLYKIVALMNTTEILVTNAQTSGIASKTGNTHLHEHGSTQKITIQKIEDGASGAQNAVVLFGFNAVIAPHANSVLAASRRVLTATKKSGRSSGFTVREMTSSVIVVTRSLTLTSHNALSAKVEPLGISVAQSAEAEDPIGT